MIDVDTINKSLGELENNILSIKAIGQTSENLKEANEKISKNISDCKALISRSSEFESEMLSKYSGYVAKIDDISEVVRKQELLFVDKLHETRTENKKVVMSIEDTINRKIEKMQTDLELDVRRQNKELEAVIKSIEVELIKRIELLQSGLEVYIENSNVNLEKEYIIRSEANNREIISKISVLKEKYKTTNKWVVGFLMVNLLGIVSILYLLLK